jgi:hypothetical protein
VTFQNQPTTKNSNTLGKTVGNVAAATSGSGAFRVRKIIQSDDFLVLLLDDLNKTKITVPVNLGGNLKPGTYKLFNGAGKLTLPSTGKVPPPSSEWLPPRVSLPAQVDYQVITPWMRLPEIAHRLQANPTLAKAPIGTRLKFWIHRDPEIGGKYLYKWKIHQDPITATQKGVREVLEGPTTPTLELTASFVGKHRICCELTFVGSNRTSKEFLEYLQVVAPEDALLNAAHAKAVAPKYDLFRIDLEMHNINLMKGGLQNQNASGEPYIKNSGMNPVAPQRAPDFSTYTYTVVPVPGAKTFRWYVRCQDWRNMPTQLFHGYKRVIIDGAPAFDLASTRRTATWIIASRNIYTIVCDQFDGSGKKVGTAWYRQVVETNEEAADRTKFQAYLKRATASIDKIQDGKEVGLQAVYLNRETGQSVPLSLFVGPAAGNSRRVVLVDLMPGVDRSEYGGNTLETALKDFERGNAYPDGSIKLKVPSNRLGLPTLTKTFQTKGESDFSRWAGRVGWASLGLTAAGIIAGLIPGGQPVAMVCFIAAGAAGVASGGLSLYDRLQKAEVNGTGVALDVASIAGSMIGAAGAVRALKMGTAFTFAGKTGRFLLYSGFATDTVAGLIISVEGVGQLNTILDNRELSRTEKLGAIIRVLATLALHGSLLVLSAKELKNVRQRVTSVLGKDVTAKLSPEALQGLTLLDENALKKLVGLNSARLGQVATLAKTDLRVANRLSLLFGEELAHHVVVPSNSRISIDGQLKLHPNLIATLSDDELRQIFKVTRDLKNVGGQLSSLADKAAAEKLTKSSGLRLRFEGQLQDAKKYVESLGAKGKIFSKMAEGERERLFDLMNSARGIGNRMKQASHWALSRKPPDVFTYVELVEMYVARFDQALKAAEHAYKGQIDARVDQLVAAQPGASKDALRRQTQREISTLRFGQEIEGYSAKLKTALREELEMSWGVPGNPEQAGHGAKIVEAAYKAGAERIKGHIGSSRIGNGLSVQEKLKRIKRLAAVRFTSEPAGVYHVEKHGHELSPGETARGRFLVSAFLASARKTIQNGTVTIKVTQGGSYQFHFLREFEEAGKKYKMFAIVNATEAGEVFLATYMNQGAK